jgi:hypothetical protein
MACVQSTELLLGQGTNEFFSSILCDRLTSLFSQRIWALFTGLLGSTDFAATTTRGTIGDPIDGYAKSSQNYNAYNYVFHYFTSSGYWESKAISTILKMP